MGILGNPVAEKKRMDDAHRRGIKLSDGFSYKRAFGNPIPETEKLMMHQAIEKTWDTPSPRVLDSFAGGGSIPFEAVRLGFPVIMNELNPVASVIEHATIEFPARYGQELAPLIKKWADVVGVQLNEKLGDCFPKQQGEETFDYIWVRTAKCPECSLTVPLSPNWWLDQKGGLGYMLQLPSDGSSHCSFKVVRQGQDGFDAEKGTVNGGRGQCPRDSNHIISEEYIKGEAQAGRMGHQLAAIVYKIKGKKGRYFREVVEIDLEGIRNAEEILARRLPIWAEGGLVPTEKFPEVSNDPRPLNFGMIRWCDFFNSRQLLVHLTTLEAIESLPLESELGPDRAKAVRTFLALTFDKALSYDSLGSRWDPLLFKITNLFERHDFSFRWSYGEIVGADGAGQLWQWALDEVIDAYIGLVKLLPAEEQKGTSNRRLTKPANDLIRAASATFLCGDAASMPSVPNGSIPCVVIDPPYSNNVMYAELSDFFYVWLKRMLRDDYPELFKGELTNKDDEAVASVARFKGLEKPRQLAENDYESKMKNSFNEIHRVLREDGVLTVMFNHKSSGAWNALARGLIETGFEITASWPVHTEGEHTLHQSGRVAAQSTILLVCRQRVMDPHTRGWWQDIKPLIHSTAFKAAGENSRRGIAGVDLLLSTYGPALQEFSRHYPVVDISGDRVQPERALVEAGSAVSDYRFSLLTQSTPSALDAYTRFYIHGWDLFQGGGLPADEVIKLSQGLNVELKDLTRYGIIRKEKNRFVLSNAEERRKLGKVGTSEDSSFPITLDKVHASELVYEELGAKGVKRLYQTHGFLADSSYLATVEALLNCLPRSSKEYSTLKMIAEYAMERKVNDRRNDDDSSSSPASLDDFPSKPKK